MHPILTKTSLALAASLCLMGFASHASAEQPGVRCVQNQLNTLGFNSGRPDGTIGTLTRKASEQYRTWMAGGAGGENWSFPALTAMNGQMWCEGIAKDHPEVANFVTPVAEPTQYTSSGAGGLVALLQHDRKLAGRCRQERPVRLARGEPQPHHLPVIIDLPVEVGRGEARVADPLGLDHGVPRQNKPACVFPSAPAELKARRPSPNSWHP